MMVNMGKICEGTAHNDGKHGKYVKVRHIMMANMWKICEGTAHNDGKHMENM
jgi:hypothetical protein